MQEFVHKIQDIEVRKNCLNIPIVRKLFFFLFLEGSSTLPRATTRTGETEAGRTGDKVAGKCSQKIKQRLNGKAYCTELFYSQRHFLHFFVNCL